MVFALIEFLECKCELVKLDAFYSSENIQKEQEEDVVLVVFVSFLINVCRIIFLHIIHTFNKG